jgi:hypothetical protein
VIGVYITINGVPILARTAVRQKTRDKGHCVYLCDDGTVLLHRREDGAVPLAKMMLDTIKEQKLAAPQPSEEKQ